MKIAVAQIDCEVGNVEANLTHLGELARSARATGCDMVVFPEMADTGYEMGAIEAAASSWDTGVFPQLCDLAAELDLYLICGLSERSERGVHNAVAAIDRRGALLAKYRKVHLFTGAPVHEERHLIAGDQSEVAEFSGFRWGMMVCYDVRFPEMARTLALRHADVLVVPSAFPHPRLRHWNTLLAARAIENQVYVVAANRVGTDGSVTFCGASQIIDPYGVVIAKAGEEEEALVSAEIDAAVIAETRASIKVFDDRVPSVYQCTSDPLSSSEASLRAPETGRSQPSG